MKFVLLTIATFLALCAFDTPTDAGCGGGGGGTGLFGRRLFGNGPFARMRTRFADRRTARTSASFGATYVRSVAGFSSTQAVVPSTQIVPPQAATIVPEATTTTQARSVPQAPPVRVVYQAAATPRTVVRQPVRNQTFGFTVYSGGCANGQCGIPR
jgi:hypothetical protein